MLKQVGRAQCEIRTCKGHPWRVSLPAPHYTPQPRDLGPGRGVPLTSGCKNHPGLCLKQKATRSLGIEHIKETTHRLSLTTHMIRALVQSQQLKKHKRHRQITKLVTSGKGLEG